MSSLLPLFIFIPGMGKGGLRRDFPLSHDLYRPNGWCTTFHMQKADNLVHPCTCSVSGSSEALICSCFVISHSQPSSFHGADLPQELFIQRKPLCTNVKELPHVRLWVPATQSKGPVVRPSHLFLSKREYPFEIQYRRYPRVPHHITVMRHIPQTTKPTDNRPSGSVLSRR